MAVRSNYSPKEVLEDIRDSVASISGLATEDTASESNEQLQEITEEVKRIRQGTELILGQEIEPLEEEE